jgi:glycerophosphoryl diester phosphodiesterase
MSEEYAMTDMICIGHRGASGHAPENTLAAFALAIKMGCPWVELDVYAVDGTLLVIHDDTLERTTNGHGRVMDTSLATLRTLDAGGGQQIPTLAEVIELVDHRAGINIELKGEHTAAPVNALLTDYLARGWQSDEFMISSFDHAELALADPRYHRGALFHKKVSDYFQRTQALDAHALNLSIKLVTPELVAAAHKEGLLVYVYTVNTLKDIQRMREYGVDGVFSNYPDRVAQDRVTNDRVTQDRVTNDRVTPDQLTLKY